MCEEILRYIEAQHKEVFIAHDKDVCIGLPYPYIAPTSTQGLFDNDQFYWDSYFIILGLLAQGNVPLAKGMVQNLAFLVNKFGIIPSRNRYYNLGISQPPLFTSMIREVYTRTQDKEWLESMCVAAKKEYRYWMEPQHTVHEGLARYCDHWYMHLTAEHESGWDMTSRFGDRCLDILPVDLNAILYKVECDLAFFHDELGQDSTLFLEAANKRKYFLCALMHHQGYFYDYNYQAKKTTGFKSVAAFVVLWAGLATPEQAKDLILHLNDFECEGGLVTTQKENLLTPYRQWDYPNGWPPLQWLTIQGLRNYGYVEDAKRLAQKWLNLNKKVFADTGKLWEKYDVVNLDVGKSGRYPTQSGFGWTNGVFIKCHAFLHKSL